MGMGWSMARAWDGGHKHGMEGRSMGWRARAVDGEHWHGIEGMSMGWRACFYLGQDFSTDFEPISNYKNRLLADVLGTKVPTCCCPHNGTTIKYFLLEALFINNCCCCWFLERCSSDIQNLLPCNVNVYLELVIWYFWDLPLWFFTHCIYHY